MPRPPLVLTFHPAQSLSTCEAIQTSSPRFTELLRFTTLSFDCIHGLTTYVTSTTCAVRTLNFAAGFSIYDSASSRILWPPDQSEQPSPRPRARLYPPSGSTTISLPPPPIRRFSLTCTELLRFQSFWPSVTVSASSRTLYPLV